MSRPESESPGQLIGIGRSADVYALDDERVLRRFRVPWDVAPEAGLMTYLRQAGFPVPKVFDADGRDLVMERLSGTDMLADLGRRPWRAARHARLLAEMHDRLHAIAPPDGLREELGGGDSVLHLDLHPANVVLTPAGPVVIDWTSAAAGPAGADVAMAQVIMASSEVSDFPRSQQAAVLVLRRFFIRRFLARASDDPRPHLEQAVELRLKDPNVRPGEAARLRALVQPGSGPDR